MADSLLDIGGEDIFPLDPNWASRPSHSYNFTRYINQYPGTSTEIETKNDEIPWIVEAEFDIQSKEEEFEFLTFIHTAYGRVKRFWLKHPKSLFRIKDPLSNGSTQINAYTDNSELIAQGYERIWIELSSGDILTRHVSAIVLDEPNNEVQLTLPTAVDRDIALSEVVRIGRILLVRFDNDRISLTIHNDYRSSTRLTFHELVKEYSELAANP
jgi:hypothetical protein